MIGFHELTMALFSAVITDRRHVAPRLNLTNVVALNYLLQSEIFVSKDRQLRVIHLIWISNLFQRLFKR